MGLLDQETQVRNSDAYDDTIAAGAGMEAPGASDQHLLFDLNALRSQIRRLLDPLGVDASTDDWFDTPLNNFGLRQIHDKKFAFNSPITPGTNDFTLGVAEVHSVDTVADVADSLDGTFFVFYETPTNAFYVWYDTPAGAGDPAPTPPGGVTYTGIQVTIATNDTANTVASNTQTQIQASAYQGTVALANGNELTLTNDTPGQVTDVADGTAATGFTIATDTQGSSTGAQGVVIDATKIVGGAGTIAVGASSSNEGGYIAADEANFTVAGTLGVGLSQASDGDGILLNKVSIIDEATNESPEDANTVVFGLLQVITGTADGTAIAGAGAENLQISFVKIDPTTDAVTAVTLPAGNYHFGAVRQRCFESLTKGAMLSGSALPDAITPGGGTTDRLPFRHIDVSAGPASPGDPLNIQTGAFTTAGAQTIFGSFGTPILPATAAEFRDDNRVKIWRNGNLQSKGAGKDVQYVSTTQISFSKTVKSSDEIVIESPASF